MQIQSVTGLMTMLLLYKDKPNSTNTALIEQMQKDIAKINEEHNPVIEAIRTAYENKKRWLKENQ
jgi:hypothetical protein